MPSEPLITTTIPMLGGYKVCGGTSVGDMGYMGHGTENYIQTPDGIRTRAPMWVCSLFMRDPASFNRFLARINAARPAAVPVIFAGRIEAIQILEYYPYRPEQTAHIPTLLILGSIRYFVIFKIVYASNEPVPRRCIVLVAWDIRLTDNDPFADTPIPPVVYGGATTDVMVGRSAVYPEIDVGYFKTFFIVTFPNTYNDYPLLFWWDQPTVSWVYLPWLSAPGQPTALATGEFPTVCTAMTVKNGVSSFLVWGCSENGSLRTTKMLTDILIHDQQQVQRLLSSDPTDNFVIPLLGGAAEMPNRGMIQFNGMLFVFGYSSCYIVPQLVVVDEQGDLVLAPQYNLAPFRGGCLNQRALAIGWNEVFVGTVEGSVYTINRVMESGQYSAVDLLASTGVLNKDINFKFKDTYWLVTPPGLGVTTFYPLKRLHLFYDYANDVMMCHFYWVEQSLDLGGNIVEVHRAALLAYRPDCANGSTGWSNLATPGGSIIIDHPTVIVFSPLVTVMPPVIVLYITPMPFLNDNRLDFGEVARWGFKHLLTTPFLAPSHDQTIFIYKSVHFEIDRLGHAGLRLSVITTTDLDTPQREPSYVVPMAFTLNNGRLDMNRFSTISTQNSFLLGIEGTHIAFTIGETPFAVVVVPWGPQDANNTNAPFMINSITLQYKAVGSAPNVSSLIPYQ